MIRANRRTWIRQTAATLALLPLMKSRPVRAAVAEPLAWPQKSGPLGCGLVPPQHASGIPQRWDESTGKNVVWKTPLPAAGHSTPVIGHGRLWMTSATADGRQQFLDVVDEGSGEVLEHRLLWTNENPEPLGNEINNYAAPTCVLEDDALYAHFGTYGTLRIAPATLQVVWQRRDIECRHFRGPGSSPIVFEDLVILTFDGIDQQFLIALDKRTGETVWRTERSTDYGDLGADGKPLRDGDLRKAYSTAGVVEVAGRTQVVSVGSRAAFGYDARTGKEIWSVTHEEYNATAQPLFYRDLAILHTGSRGAHILAVRLDATTQGIVNETHLAWDRPRGNSGMAFPVMQGNRVYTVTDTGVANCIDAATGEQIWSDRIGGTHISSPLIANELVYFFSVEGTGYVVRAADTFELLEKNELSEGMRASPAAANGALFLRSHDSLYKIGAGKA